MKKTILTRLPISLNKGFISLYFLIVLSVVINNCLTITNSYKKYLHYLQEIDDFQRINNIEILCINRIKQDYRLYQEKDETLYYNGALINIVYNGLNCDLTINYKGNIRERTLHFDEVENVICEYY